MKKINIKEGPNEIYIRKLIGGYESCQGILNAPSHLGINMRHKLETELEQVKSEISRIVLGEGNQGSVLFTTELDRLDNERRGEYRNHRYVDYWTQAAQSDPSPSMSEYYENEGRIANTEPRENLRAIDSIREFLRQLGQDK